MTEVTMETNPEIERNWAMLAHVLGLLPPFLNVLGPLLVWFIKKDSSSFIDTNAREAANYQVTVLIAFFISLWLCLFLIGFFLIGAIAVTNLVLVFIAAVKAKKGESFRYPFALRFF
jgi:uncharacterized Tic20 family protein